MELLVIGASGYIGNEIYKEALKRNIHVIGTKYKAEAEGLFDFNIVKDSIVPIANRLYAKDKYAVICSAVTKIDECNRNKETSYNINVTSTKKLIQDLTKAQFKIVYLSSDNVFDGTKECYSEQDLPSPINEYGRMKASVERYISNSIPDACIMRIGKTVGAAGRNQDMFHELILKWEKNEVIYCIKNNFLTLSDIRDVVNCFFIIINNNMSGIYNIVGSETYLRINLVRCFFQYINKKPKITEKNLEAFGFQDKRPLRLVLSNQKFIQETGYRFYNIEETFEQYKILNKRLEDNDEA